VIPTDIALEARANLEWVAGKWWDLRAHLRRPSGDPNAPKVKGSKEPPAVINLHVSDLLHEITTEAVLWGRILIEEADWRQEHGEMPGLLVDVASQYGHFVCDEDEKVAYDFCDTAAEFRRKVEGVLNREEGRKYRGPCPNEKYLGAGCPGELYGRDGEGGTCPSCGESWSWDGQRIFILGCAHSVLMEQREIVEALWAMGSDVKPNTVYKWCQRGKIAKEDGLYRFADAVELSGVLNREDAEA